MTIARQIKEKADSEDVLRKQIKTLAQIEQGGRQMNGAIQDKAIDMALDALEVAMSEQLARITLKFHGTHRMRGKTAAIALYKSNTEDWRLEIPLREFTVKSLTPPDRVWIDVAVGHLVYKTTI